MNTIEVILYNALNCVVDREVSLAPEGVPDDEAFAEARQFALEMVKMMEPGDKIVMQYAN